MVHEPDVIIRVEPGGHRSIGRYPDDVLASYRCGRATATLDDLGIVQQARIYDHVVGMQGEPMVLDAKDVLMNPEGALRTVCAALGINFDPNMLSWPAGKRASAYGIAIPSISRMRLSPSLISGI